ncbi:MAG: SurA N-terminal domain-containing protein [Candidatus Omnitrophica bacterium]|nr:SurA N-terminal domain-containing protein [Candidatus Omnitrophota bacterium]
MLKLLRHKRVAKIVLWGLVVLILPAFVLWGTGSLSGPKDKGPKCVGIIDDKKISFDEFFLSVASIRSQIILHYFNQPQVLERLLGDKEFLARLAWDRLVMLREAEKENIKVPDQDVINIIRNHPLFSRNGKFDDSLYRYVLRNNMGLDARNFEEMVRRNLKIQKLQDILTTHINATDTDALNEYKKENEKFRISYVFVESKDFLDQVKIDDKTALDYYERNRNEFLLPPKAGEEPGPEPRIAEFENVKPSIKSYLSEKEALLLSRRHAEEVYGRLKASMDNKKEKFREAASEAGLKTQDSKVFSKSDYLEGVGEASRITEAAVMLKPGQVSAPIEVRKGSIIFELLEAQGIDEEKFEKEKKLYAAKAIAYQKNAFLEKWLRNLELQAKVNIAFDDWEKYYR